MKRVSRVLAKARALICEHGFCRFSFQEDGKMCARGAIAMAATGDATSFGGWTPSEETKVIEGRLIAPLAIVVGAIGSDRQHDAYVVANWNNADGRTADEVLAAFDEAVAIAESAELTDKHWRAL